MRSGALCTARCRSEGEPCDGDVQEYVAANPTVLTGEVRAALEGCGGDEVAGGAASQIGTHLKRKVYLDAHRTDDKRTRTDSMHDTVASAVTAGEGTHTTTEQTPSDP